MKRPDIETMKKRVHAMRRDTSLSFALHDYAGDMTELIAYIEHLEREEAELPTIMDLKGIAPPLPDGVSSDD